MDVTPNYVSSFNARISSFFRQENLMLISSFDVEVILFRLFCNSGPSDDTIFNIRVFIVFLPWSQMSENLNVPSLSYKRELVPSKGVWVGSMSGIPAHGKELELDDH